MLVDMQTVLASSHTIARRSVRENSGSFGGVGTSNFLADLVSQIVDSDLAIVLVAPWIIRAGITKHYLEF